jgi:MinD-like ATPase involved in chromosome partitioning or flagellar assembly/DNA-binding NarL/FixJ family response regulator
MVRKLMLIVDPDLDFVEDLRDLLSDRTVLSARSMTEAKEIVLGRRVEMVVLGPSFGSEAGVQGAAALVDADPDAAIVLVANIVTNRVLRAALQVGLLDVVDTPVTRRKLNEALARSAARAMSVGDEVVAPTAPPMAHLDGGPSQPEAASIVTPEPVAAAPTAVEGVELVFGGAAIDGRVLEFSGHPSAASAPIVREPVVESAAGVVPEPVAPVEPATAEPVADVRPEPVVPVVPVPVVESAAVVVPEPSPTVEPAPAEPVADVRPEPVVPAPVVEPAPAVAPEPVAPVVAQPVADPIVLEPAANDEAAFDWDRDDPFGAWSDDMIEMPDTAPAPGPAPAPPSTAPPMPVEPPPMPVGAPPAPSAAPPVAVGPVTIAPAPVGPTPAVAVERPAPRRLTGNGRVISVTAGKAGSGKTVAATNLAAAMTERLGPDRVVIVDADLQFGDVALLLQLDPTRTLVDAAEAIDGLSDARFDSMLLVHESGLRVLPAPLLPLPPESAPIAGLISVIERLKRMYDVVIVDTPPIFGPTLLSILDHSDTALMVVDMDLPSVKNAKIAIDALRNDGYPADRLHLVVNRVNSKARLDLVELERSLGLRVSGSVPSDRIVPQSVNEGIPVVLLSPRSRVAKSFHSLAERFGPDRVRVRRAS